MYRCVLISGGLDRGVLLCTDVSSFQGVWIEEFYCVQMCPHFRGIGIEEFYCVQMCPHFRGFG